MKECPGEGPDTAGQGRASGPEPEELPGRCSVPGLSTAVGKELSGFDVRRPSSRESGPKHSPSGDSNVEVDDLQPAEQETAKAEREARGRGGGWEWWEREDGDGGPRTGDGEIVSGGGSVPSAGWREVAAAYSATEGQSHE